jgi:esterase/lipase superfamily enzyme
MTARLRSATASVRRSAGILLVAAALAGCGTRGEIVLVDTASATAGTSHQVLVATPRAPAAAPAYFSGERDFDLNFARFSVSVPPDRKSGEIRYPKGEPDPQRDFVVTETTTLDGSRGFVTAINAAASRLPARERNGVVFVHGFNNNFAESLYKAVQLDHDLKTPGVGLLFSWPSKAKVLAYESDRESALFARDDLAQTLRLMSKTNLDGFNVVAHSMGTFLTMETLRSMALAGEQATFDRIDAVVLISADIEIDVFRRQAPAVLAMGVPIYLLVADDDKALRFSAAIRGESVRVGSVRTTGELGNIDVSIIDLSDIESEGDGGHMKVGSSPELIAFIQRIRESGITIFDDGQKVGLLDQGAVLLQGTTGVILKPLGK